MAEDLWFDSSPAVPSSPLHAIVMIIDSEFHAAGPICRSSIFKKVKAAFIYNYKKLSYFSNLCWLWQVVLVWNVCNHRNKRGLEGAILQEKKYYRNNAEEIERVRLSA